MNMQISQFQQISSAFNSMFENRRASIHVHEASSFDDFRQATQLMTKTSREKCSPIEPRTIGALLSQMNHGGSGPNIGAIILAQKEHRTVGFALLIAKPGNGMNLTWLHAENDSEIAVELLWHEALDTSRKWGFPILGIGAFVQLPQSVTSEENITELQNA